MFQQENQNNESASTEEVVTESQQTVEVTPQAESADAGEAPVPTQENSEQSTGAENQAPVSNVPSDQRLYGALCYIPGLSIVTAPFNLHKFPKVAFSEGHSANGLGLFALNFLSVFVALIPFVGGIFWLVLLGLAVWGGVSAWSGKSLSIPLVAQLGAFLIKLVKPMLGQVEKVANTATGETVETEKTDASTSPEAEVAEATPVVAEEAQIETQEEAAPVVEEEKVEAPAPTEEVATPVADTAEIQTEESKEPQVNKEPVAVEQPVQGEASEESETQKVEGADAPQA